MDIALLSLAAFLISILTFFSGFGLGTLLTPIFMIYFPVEMAIFFTGIVHLFNNIFKILLVGRHFHREVMIRFGLPAVAFAIVGSYLLFRISDMSPWYSYELNHKVYDIYPIKVILSILLLIFSGIELIPYFKKIEFNKDKLILGGVLSGFFGGLSGVQGAFRSAFLVRVGLTKEEFVSTTVIISTFVDISRISMYYNNFQHIKDINYVSVIYPIVGALVGSYLGLNLLKKVTIESIQLLVGILLGIFAICLGTGII